LLQQRQNLDRMKLSAAEAQARISLQMRINDAVVTGKGWETIPPDIRRQADTPWFRTWLLFDPSIAFRRIDQPVLILHGSLDREVPASHGERLEEIAAARKNARPGMITRVVVPGVNHLLIAAKTGDRDEYDLLTDQNISADLVSAVVGWINQRVKAS